MVRIPLKYNLRSLWQRKSRTALTVLGIAAVIAVFVAMTAFGRGMASAFSRTGSLDNLVVLQKGAFNQSLSSLPQSSRDVVQYLPFVKRQGDLVLASPELAIEPWVKSAGKKSPTFMLSRGVTPVFFEVADSLVLLAGASTLGGNRVLLGQGARQKLGGVRLGETIGMFGESWQVAGFFAAGGSNLEFEILADLNDLMRAANREEISCFTLKLDDPAHADRAIAQLESDRRYLLTALREPEYYAGSGRIYGVVARMGLLISFIVTLGAVFGGMNTMYTAVASRMREVGMLRALGFSGGDVLKSFLLESLLLGLLGGVLGVALGSLVGGLRISILTANIRFSIGAGVLLAGLALSAAVGLIGGLLPARAAARLPILEAMRQVH